MAGSGARRPEERGRGRGGGAGRTCSPSTGRPWMPARSPRRWPPSSRSRAAPSRWPQPLGRGRRLLEVPLRQAGDGLLRPSPRSEVERGLRAPRRDQRGRQRPRQEAGRRGVLELRPGEPPTEADAQGQRRPARGEDAREEGFRAPAPAPRRCSPGACPQAKANAATAAELVRWLWALGAMCREATE